MHLGPFADTEGPSSLLDLAAFLLIQPPENRTFMVIRESNVRLSNSPCISSATVPVSNDRYLISFLFLSMRKEIILKKI